jgi:hypothetical protein
VENKAMPGEPGAPTALVDLALLIFQRFLALDFLTIMQHILQKRGLRQFGMFRGAARRSKLQ